MRGKEIGFNGNRHWTCKKKETKDTQSSNEKDRKHDGGKESHCLTDKKIYKHFSFSPILLVPPLSARLVIVVNGSARQWR
jgi:hypothetical protein